MAMKVLIGISIVAHALLGAAAAEVPPPVKTALLETYGKLPLSFEANAGQADPRVKFLARGRGYTLFLTSTEAVLMLRDGEKTRPTGGGSPNRTPSADRHRGPEKSNGEPRTSNTAFRMHFDGANADAPITGLEALLGIVNYFRGTDPKNWRTDISTYAKVQYKEIYPGIDLVYYGNQGQLEYDLLVAPGADPKSIKLVIQGAEDVALTETGDLRLKTAGGDVRLLKPHVYQTIDGRKTHIAARYVVRPSPKLASQPGENGRGKASVASPVGIELAAYDPTRLLVIDPVLVYSTYLGGMESDTGHGIAVDAAGQVYVTGVTASADFPTTAAAFQPERTVGGVDVFVAKLDSTGSELLYSTYLSGSGGEEGLGIAVDGAGQAYVTGFTQSADFPTTEGSFQPELRGFLDAFVTKLTPTGSGLLYSTYLGGSNGDAGSRIAVDAAGQAYVTGNTDSADFPTTATAFQPGFGGISDAFVTKLNSTGSGLLYSTYLGGARFDVGLGIAVDAEGQAYVTGFTLSTNFPTAAAFQPGFGGVSDAFMTKLTPTGSGLLYSTYLGGARFEEGHGIAISAAGQAHVTGATASTNFPTTADAFQPGFGGVSDAFVTKLHPTGAGLLYSTYLGGAGSDNGFGIAVDAAGQAHVTGSTASADFPTTADAFQPGSGGADDAFVTKLTSTGSRLLSSTYLGGSGNDSGTGITVDAAGQAYVTGGTASADFPTTATAFQPVFGGSQGDAFVAKLSSSNTPLGSNVTVQLGQGTVTFASVTAAGDTTLTTSADGPPPPDGFKLGDPRTYYELATTASFGGAVTVCIDYASITFQDDARLQLFHFEEGRWVNATVSLDAARDIICGGVRSLSPFAIFEPAAPPIQPFATLGVSVEVEDERDERELEVEARFTLAATSDGIAPLTEDVVVQVGTFSATIPAGSFRGHGSREFTFEGDVDGVALEVKIRSRRQGRFDLTLEAEGVGVASIVNPVTVGITIGNDGGTAMVTAEFDD
jgi:hypothetical protein